MDNAALKRILSGEQWSNAACCGYLLLACKSLKLERAQIDTLLSCMKAVFDSYSVESAKDVYMRY